VVIINVGHNEEIFSSRMLHILLPNRKMAASCLVKEVCLLHSQLFKLPGVTELSLIRWASKKTGQFSYTHIQTRNCYVRCISFQASLFCVPKFLFCISQSYSKSVIFLISSHNAKRRT
jgi:hypothetical protein